VLPLSRLASLVCACVIVSVVPAAASANDFSVGSPQFQRAVAVATAHWGSMPCGGQVQYGWVDEDPEVNATSYWTPGSPNTGCSIRFNRAAEWDDAKFCTIMTHELGHLHGRGHSDDPNDLMSPIYSSPLPACGGVPAPAQGGGDDAGYAEEGDGEDGAWGSTAGERARHARAARRSSRRCVRRSRATRRCVRWSRRPARRRARSVGHVHQRELPAFAALTTIAAPSFGATPAREGGCGCPSCAAAARRTSC
jgi:hypothetical protein